MVQLTRRRFTVDEYYKLADAGILTEDDRVELLDGEIITMTPIGSRHGGCVKRLNRLFNQRLGDRVIVGVQDPIRLDIRSEPQPDIVLARRRADYYSTSHPRPEEVLLLVEVADTSLEIDRDVKLPLYARAGVPEVWLVDLPGEAITVYRDPTTSGYRSAATLQRGARLAPALLPDVALDVTDILGEQPAS